MTLYVKKRIPVEARHFDPETYGLDAALRHLYELVDPGYIDVTDPEDWEDPEVRQLAVWDKLHNVWVPFYDGDWIIKGVQGEFYPCNEEVFAQTYEEYDGD